MKKILLPCLALLALNSYAEQSNQSLATCSAIKNDFKRLLCYDEVVKGSGVVPASVVAAAAPAQATNANNNFGVEHKRISENGADEITATVSSVKKAPHGELIVRLDNNQQWRQIGADAFRLASGNKVVIKRGMFNSFLMKKLDGNKTIRVKRVK